MLAEVLVAREKPKPVKSTEAPKPAPDKGEPVSVKLFKAHARKLAELAREEQLDGGSAEAFDKHFGHILDNLLIAAKAKRLQRLQDEVSAS